MYEDIRITGKFKPLEEDRHEINVNTEIYLPHFATEIKKNEIVWRRITGDNVEDLVHLDGNPFY